MARKFLDLDGLTAYDNKIKEYINERIPIEYGVRMVTGQSSPVLERVTRRNGIIAPWDITYTPNVGGTVNDNPFDNIDIFSPEVWTDDFGNKFARFSQFYTGRQIIGQYTYIWVCSKKLYEFYRIPKAFNDCGTQWDYVDIALYEGSEDTIDGTSYLASKSGKYPLSKKTRTQFYELAKAYNTKLGNPTDEYYLITTMSEWTEIITPLMLIMYGTRNTQAIYKGAVSLWSGLTVAAYDKTTKTIYYNNTTQEGYHVGMCFALNNSTDVADYRTVTENGAVKGTIIDGVFTPDESGTTYYYIKCEGDLPDNLTKCSQRPLPTGSTDDINATSGTQSNNGLYAFKAFNIENWYGNIEANILDCTISAYVPYICKDLTTWTDTTTPATSDNFEAVGYEVVQLSGAGSGVKELGFDTDHYDVQLPIEAGGSTGTYYCDNVYANIGPRTFYGGGSLFTGAAAGLFCWELSSGVGYSGWRAGARLSHRALKGG